MSIHDAVEVYSIRSGEKRRLVVDFGNLLGTGEILVEDSNLTLVGTSTNITFEDDDGVDDYANLQTSAVTINGRTVTANQGLRVHVTSATVGEYTCLFMVNTNSTPAQILKKRIKVIVVTE